MSDRRPRNPRGRLNYCSLVLFQYEDVVLLADVVQLLRPHRDRDFTEVRLAEQEHLDPALTDAAADGLDQVLAAATTTLLGADPVAIPLLQRFTGGVWVQDTTTVGLPLSACNRICMFNGKAPK